MNKTIHSLLLLGFISYLSSQDISIHQQQSEEFKNKNVPPADFVKIQTGFDILLAEKSDVLKNKKIALVTNHTGVDDKGIPNYKRLMEIDGVELKVIFSPEHGLFGEAAAGEKVNYDGKIIHLPKVISLYGKNRKPDPALLDELDWVIYDIQDVGARFYTYISTLGLVMESAAKAGVPVMVLDRPNPIRGDKVEGPVLNVEFKSFVGFYPIPVRYGLTVGELAKMIAGENWINSIPELTVVWMKGWKRSLWYDEITTKWNAPSPNIPNLETATVYSGTCLIEATNVSEGRGTDNPFLWIGAPWINSLKLSQALNKQSLPGVIFKPITFLPKDIPGAAINPKYNGQECKGVEIFVIDRNSFLPILMGVSLLSTIKELYPNKVELKEASLKRLWGKSDLNKLRKISIDPKKLLESYEDEINKFKSASSQYLFYE